VVFLITQSDSKQLKSSEEEKASFQINIETSDVPAIIVCRICEENIPEDTLAEHSKYCVTLRQCMIRLQECDDALLSVNNSKIM
jgi:hypothetical protein